MSLNSCASDQASFLHSRDPSILGWNQRVHYVAPVRKQLFSEILEEENSKPEQSAIKTYLRLKPTLDIPANEATFTLLNDTTVVTNPPKDSVTFKNQSSGRVIHQYSFTKVLSPEVNQKEVFDECVAYQVKDFILGSNCLLFAYGTTNAGKTFTIQGDGTSPGIIPRSLDLLFKSIRGQVASIGRYRPDKVEGIVQLDSATVGLELDYKNRVLQWNWDKPLEPIKSRSNSSCSNSTRSSESDFISSTFREMQKTLSNDSPVDVPSDSDVVYGVWVSFAEVYNECVFDLLDPIVTRGRKRVPLRMAQDSEGIAFIRDLRQIHVSSGDEAFHVMLYGKANLQIAATNMNSQSSRSHCIFTVKLVRYANSDNPAYAIVSSFTFCDLAGAERAKKTLNAGDRLKESNNINTSLHVLGRCLATIRENQKKNDNKPIPFRDSKLTRIFQRALTGHERITMIVNANMSPVLYDETVNVLKFSAIAKQIIFQAPIKKPKAVKKSRFSIMVSRPNPHGTICWDEAPEDVSANTTSSKVSSESAVQKYNAQNEELLGLVERLKSQLAEERQKNLTLERDIRQSVTETFSKIISDMENSWKTRMQDMEERNEHLSSWRIAQLENYYKQQLEGSRKRRRESDLDDSIIVCDTPNQDDRIHELVEEVQILEEKCSAVHQLLKEAQEIQSTLSADNSSLKFDLSAATTELENCRRQLLAAEKQVKGTPDALVQELQLQLGEEIKKKEYFRELLDEAKQEFLVLDKDKEELELEVTKMQAELVEKSDELVETTNQLDACQLLLTQKTRAHDTLEEKYDALLKTHGNCEKDLSEISVLLKEHEGAKQVVEDLQVKLQSLSVSDESCQLCPESDGAPKSILSLSQALSDVLQTKLNQCMQIKSEFEGLKKELQETSANLKDKEDEKKSLESEIINLKNSIAISLSEKNESNSRVSHLEKEVKLLQKDVKDMLQKNIKLEQDLKESQKQLEDSHNSTCRLEHELKSALQKSNSQLNESESSQSVLQEALQVKAKTHEETMQLLNVWKEEVNQLKEQVKEACEENQRLKEQLNLKEAEMETFNVNRSQLMSRYEEALKKSQEETEREKREIVSLRDALYKSTPTPKKNESAEIRLLKDRVEYLQAELSVYKTDDGFSAKKAVRSSRKAPRQESNSSNESIKENIEELSSVPLSSSKSKKTAIVDGKEVPHSSSKKKLMKEPSIPPPAAEESTRRKGGRKKLFSRTESRSLECDEEETIEVEYLTATTPNSYVKRSLRTRKV